MGLTVCGHSIDNLDHNDNMAEETYTASSGLVWFVNCLLSR